MPDSATMTFGQTIEDALRHLRERGYTGSLSVVGPGKLKCEACLATMDARRASFERTYRIEGASDPADEVIVLAVACPACSAKASLVLHFGIGASPEEASVIAAMRDKRKLA